MRDYESIRDQREAAKARMCEECCRYPRDPIPEGKDEAWLLEDDSPCITCPLNDL